MAEEGDLLYKGKVYDPNTMTYREGYAATDVRAEIRAALGVDDSVVNIDHNTLAIAMVLIRRDYPDFSVDDGMGLAPASVWLSAQEAGKLNAPPTKASAKRRASGTPGLQK